MKTRFLKLFIVLAPVLIMLIACDKEHEEEQIEIPDPVEESSPNPVYQGKYNFFIGSDYVSNRGKGTIRLNDTSFAYQSPFTGNDTLVTDIMFLGFAVSETEYEEGKPWAAFRSFGGSIYPYNGPGKYATLDYEKIEQGGINHLGYSDFISFTILPVSSVPSPENWIHITAHTDSLVKGSFSVHTTRGTMEGRFSIEREQ